MVVWHVLGCVCCVGVLVFICIFVCAWCSACLVVFLDFLMSRLVFVFVYWFASAVFALQHIFTVCGFLVFSRFVLISWCSDFFCCMLFIGAIQCCCFDFVVFVFVAVCLAY